MIKYSIDTIFKKDNEAKTEKQSNVNTAEKYKLWKYDYFREKDKEAMSEVIKQLKKQRVKKSSNNKSLNKVNHKPAAKSANKQVGKSSSKIVNKPQSGVARSKFRK